MWYRGNNEKRPWVAGKPLKKGIIERRDELLDILVNQSTKVRAILTGDEHNYCKTEIGPETVIYNDDWEGERLELTRTIYQVNNGAAGHLTTPRSKRHGHPLPAALQHKMRWYFFMLMETK